MELTLSVLTLVTSTTGLLFNVDVMEQDLETRYEHIKALHRSCFDHQFLSHRAFTPSARARKPH